MRFGGSDRHAVGLEAPGKQAEKTKFRFLINNGRSNQVWQSVYLDQHNDFVWDRMPFAFIQMNPQDVAELHLKPGDLAEVHNDNGSTQAMVWPTPSAKRNQTFMLFAYPTGAVGNVVSNGVNEPTGLTVDGAGTVYCANVGNSTVTEYPKGQTTPSVTLSVFGEYLATDAQDNLYVSNGSEVIEFAKGSTSGKNLNLVIGSPEAIEVDQSGNLIVLDWNNDDIDIFPAGQTSPSKQITATSGLWGRCAK